MKLFKLSCNI